MFTDMGWHLISHVLNTAVYGAPLATDAMDAKLGTRAHTGNTTPLKRFYRDLRHSPLTTRTFFRPWAMVYDLSESFYTNGASKMFTIVGLN